MCTQKKGNSGDESKPTFSNGEAWLCKLNVILTLKQNIFLTLKQMNSQRKGRICHVTMMLTAQEPFTPSRKEQLGTIISCYPS